MCGLVVRRLAVLPILLMFVSLLVFFLPRLAGVDPTFAILHARVPDRNPDPEVLQRIRVELGLDRPMPFRFLNWLERLGRGDLGYSYVTRQPVAGLLREGLSVTATLVGLCLALAVAVAIPLGVVAAVRPGKWLDNLIAIASQVGVAVPEYWIALLLILLFAQRLGWLPSAGWRGPAYMIMPVLTLAFRPIAYFAWATRAAVIEAMKMDYIRAARARGLTRTQTIWVHALRNALIPVVTLVALWLAGMLGGSVIVEVIFGIPGIGLVLYSAVLATDLPLIQAGLVFLISLAVVINTLADLAYVALNPAIRLARPQP
ncbi:MAG TPA: ABC transporter permease [bacterium]|nr:ABC transporter permease [bacterium]